MSIYITEYLLITSTSRALNIFTAVCSPSEQAVYLAIMGTIFGIATILGPVIGGAFATSSATWRWVGWIQKRRMECRKQVMLIILVGILHQPGRRWCLFPSLLDVVAPVRSTARRVSRQQVQAGRLAWDASQRIYIRNLGHCPYLWRLTVGMDRRADNRHVRSLRNFRCPIPLTTALPDHDNSSSAHFPP